MPERFDILTGSPARSSRTIWTSLTSNGTCLPSVSAATAALIRLTVPAWSAPQMSISCVGRLRLLEMIGEVGAEIGPAAVRLADRPVLVVAELGRAEQRQLDRLPILGRLALGRLEHAVIDEVARAQPGLGRLGLARRLQLGLGREHVVMDAEQREVVAGSCSIIAATASLAEQGQPFAFGRADVSGRRIRRRAPRRPASDSRPDRGLRGSRRSPRRAPRGSAGAPSGRAYRPAPPASLT